MLFELQEIHTSAWDILDKAVNDSGNPFHYLSLASVAGGVRPKVRLLVLRNVDSQQYCLEFHTDTRSPKWRELEASAQATVLGFDPEQRIQLRLEGSVKLYGPKCEENQRAWSSLSPWAQNTYCGGPPGDPIAMGESNAPQQTPPSYETVVHGRERFGVIIFKAKKMDWFRLAQGDNRRAMFEYADQNSEPVPYWVMP